ncbi:MAG TPA: hypothetical protein VGB85_21915, partial [Nannocystis sp.]
MRRPAPLKLSTPLLPLLLLSVLGGCGSDPADSDTEASTGTAAGSTGTATDTGAASFPTSTETPTTEAPTTDAGTGTGDTTGDDTGEPPAPVDLDPWRDAIMYFVFVDRFANGDPGNDAPLGAPVDPEADYLGGDWK